MKATHLKRVARSAALLCLAAAALSGFVLVSYAAGFTSGWRPSFGPRDAGAMDPLSATCLLLEAIGIFLTMSRGTRRLGLLLCLLGGAGAAMRSADVVLASDYADWITPFLGPVLAERAAGMVNHMGLNTAAAILCCTVAVLLLTFRQYALAQSCAALALAAGLVSGVGYLLGAEVLFGRMPVLTMLGVLLCSGAILAGTGHRGALRAILSDSQPGRFARNQLMIVTLTPFVFAVIFARLLPAGEQPRAVAETVVTASLVAWISIGANVVVGRRLDIARHRAEAELRTLARRDALTGLLNRRSMDTALAERFEAARKDGQPISLLMCDLDHFKKLNDEFGHACGDQVLKRTADRISASVRDTDLVFRYGGEEILVLLDCGSADAIRIAEKIREAVKEPGRRSADPDLPPVTISIGGATSEQGATDQGRVLTAADESLYAAKDAGRDRVVHVSKP